MDKARKYASLLGAAALVYVVWKRYRDVLVPPPAEEVLQGVGQALEMTREFEARVREIAREVAREEVMSMSAQIEQQVRRSLQGPTQQVKAPVVKVAAGGGVPPYNAELGDRRF